MASRKRITFDEYTLDAANELIWKGSERIVLRPKTFALLQYLAEKPGQLLVKNELLNALWQDIHVGEEALKHCVAEIRKALNDDAAQPRYIETVHRRGYRFIGKSGAQPAAKTRQRTIRRPDQMPDDKNPLLVGRSAELTTLNHLLAKATGGERQVAFVAGDQGIGKTSLVDAFLDTVNSGLPGPSYQKNGHPLLIARGQCVKSHGPSEAYMPFLEAFTGLCHSSSRNRLVAALRRHAPLWLAQMPSLVGAAQLKALRQSALGAFPERMPREMAEFLEALTSETSLILVLEDLHWSDYSTLDLICYWAQRRGAARLLLIATYRPMETLAEDHPLRAIKLELEARQRCREISISYLNSNAVSEYLSRRFRGHKFPGEMASWLQQRTGGNPLFMVNVLDHLMALGNIVRYNKHWILKISLQNAEQIVPPTVQQIIERQLERCTPREQLLLQAASVQGVEFSTGGIAAALGDSAESINKRCRSLADRSLLLRQSGTRPAAGERRVAGYRFMHALYQNTCYQLMPEELQSRFHRLAAKHIETINSANLEELAARLALHLDRGKEHQQALKYYQQAADNANSRYAGREALELATRGLQLLEMLPQNSERAEREMSLRIALGTALMTVRGIGSEEVNQAFGRARELFGALGKSRHSRKKRLLFSALFGLWNYHWVRAEYALARELADQLLQMAETEHNASLLNQAHHALGIIMMDHGEFAGAFEHLKQCSGVVSRCLAALTGWNLGFPDQATEIIEDTLAFAANSRNLEDRIFAQLGAARVYMARRDVQKTLDHAQAAMDLALEHKMVEQWTAPMRCIRGWALCKLGQPHNGMEQVRQALAVVQATGNSNLMSLLLAIFAEISMDAGFTEEGLAAVDTALDIAGRTSMNHYDAETCRLKGELLLKMAAKHTLSSGYDPQIRDAESAFEQAIEVSRRQQGKSFELRATTSLARLLQRQGRQVEARNRLSDVYQRFSEGLNTTDLRDAGELLNELS